jgi:hypothetical protein
MEPMRTLTRILLLTLAAALATGPWSAISAQQATISAGPHSAIEPAGDSFHFPSQTLHYDAEWRLWKAGTATLRIEPSGEMEHVIATAEASGAVAVVYRVEDRIESYFDHRTNCSGRILKHSEEGFHKRETTLVFDPARGKSVLDERNLRSGETQHRETDSPACVTDVLSGIFYVGSQRLEPGSVHVFPLNDGGKTVDVTSFVEGREEVKTDAGTFRTVRVAVYSNAAALKGRGKVWIWYTDDAAHLPVQMRSRLFWGTMTLRLTRVEK